jgi:hypothetical protein
VTEAEAVAALDAISGGDNETNHSDADGILLDCVSPAVADAYRRLVERCSWWAHA